MKTKEQAIHDFWNSFGIKAYDATTVPSNATYPYLTYTNPTDTLGNVVSINVNLWYRSSSWKEASLKKDEIARRIIGPTEVPTVKFDDGRIYFGGGTPFSQRVDDDDPAIKRYYMNITAEFLCQY